MVSSSAAQSFAPKSGILFDNLDAHRGYRPFTFYGQSKLANLAFAKSMAERLRSRRITSNALHPGVIMSTELTRSLGSWVRAIIPIVTAIGSKSIPQGAATTCFVAAHPAMAGKTGGFYADCRAAKPNPHADDPAFRQRLWDVSANILAHNAPA
jgi:WW domain-containing oxidoreductase